MKRLLSFKFSPTTRGRNSRSFHVQAEELNERVVDDFLAAG